MYEKLFFAFHRDWSKAEACFWWHCVNCLPWDHHSAEGKLVLPDSPPLESVILASNSTVYACSMAGCHPPCLVRTSSFTFYLVLYTELIVVCIQLLSWVSCSWCQMGKAGLVEREALVWNCVVLLHEVCCFLGRLLVLCRICLLDTSWHLISDVFLRERVDNLTVWKWYFILGNVVFWYSKLKIKICREPWGHEK